MSNRAYTTDELLALLRGEDLSIYRIEKALRKEIETEAAQYIDCHQSMWPPLIFNWDLSPASQRHALDGVSQAQFETSFPNGLVSAWVDLVDFDKHLCQLSRRNGDAEVWGLGDKFKLARLIAYLQRGLPITPPMVAVTTTNEFHLQGGNHRYVAAKASGVQSLPIYLEQKNFAKANDLVNLRGYS